MRQIRIGLAVVAALLAAACLPVTSKTPIGSTAGFAPDPGLYGMWRGQGKDDDAPGYISFLRNEDGSMTALMITPPHGDDAGDWEVLSLKVAALGDHHFLNAREVIVNGKPVAEQDDPLGNIPVYYRIEGATLTLYLLDEKAAADAIRAGKIEGTIGTGTDPDVHITSGAKALDAFFASKDAEALFNEPMVTLTKID